MLVCQHLFRMLGEWFLFRLFWKSQMFVCQHVVSVDAVLLTADVCERHVCICVVEGDSRSALESVRRHELFLIRVCAVVFFSFHI